MKKEDIGMLVGLFVGGIWVHLVWFGIIILLDII